MLGVRCQVELSRPRNKDSIVCESPSHCRNTFLAARRDGTGRLLRRSDSLLVEVTVRGEMWFTSTVRLRAFVKCFMGYTATSATRNLKSVNDSMKKVGHENKAKFSQLQTHSLFVCYRKISKGKTKGTILEARVNMRAVSLCFSTCLFSRHPLRWHAVIVMLLQLLQHREVEVT